MKTHYWVVANNVIYVVLKGYALIPPREIYNYINAIDIVLAEFPETYWYVEKKLKPCVHTKSQLVFLCHVVGPFLQLIEQETPKPVAGVDILLNEMLEVVDKHHEPTPLEYMDPICDLLHHIKYI
ncbi:mediator of RNA polymerase II transcription subunit 23-like [Glossina fuscipes fuscipes]